jgi:hypothetical protein
VRLEPYTPGCRELLSSAASEPASGRERVLEAARRRLSHDVDRLRDILAAEISAWAEEGMGDRDLLCHETGTHFKWFLGRIQERGLIFWVHQYKPAAARAPTYADTIHNHRYSFASVMLRGGYDHVHYASDGLRLVVRRVETYRPPASYVLAADAPHRVTNLLDGTLTVVVQGPPERGFSTVFDPQSGERRHLSYNERIPGLLAGVHAGSDAS